MNLLCNSINPLQMQEMIYSRFNSEALGGICTHDLVLTKDVLYRLSY